MNCTATPMGNTGQARRKTRRTARSWAAATAAWMLALAAAAAVWLPIVMPAAAKADTCGSVGGRHWSVSGCPAPPAYDPPPPTDYTPNATVCAQGGRWFSWSACK
ncbi:MULTISPECIES: hypothetical protein [unclassified Mycobacterium]|uniref:hypothetical protein n=1 Tax=unclassified Mycobacterium TaxID=2642494 RepID=UPI00096CE45B|nr:MULTISPECIES: hypothetical protein [unclassified Mycobacterium]OMC22501.1 hypothetical protein A5736_10065 [Mycobacterium sp. SP-6446]OMC57275.1 hypothetical protein A5747_04210 [Mycobacterium sp. IS-836]